MNITVTFESPKQAIVVVRPRWWLSLFIALDEFTAYLDGAHWARWSLSDQLVRITDRRVLGALTEACERKPVIRQWADSVDTTARWRT